MFRNLNQIILGYEQTMHFTKQCVLDDIIKLRKGFMQVP